MVSSLCGGEPDELRKETIVDWLAEQEAVSRGEQVMEAGEVGDAEPGRAGPQGCGQGSGVLSKCPSSSG
jgi:hypothetical protein